MRAIRRALIVAVAGGMIPGAAGVMAQHIAIGPPSFQANGSSSLETVILDRLALGGQYEPEDLATLAHLTVLESISMLADVNADMPNSILGLRLEVEIRQLWDAAAVFEESVSATPVNAQMLTDVQPLYTNMQAAYQQIETTLGGSVGLSNRAANHLEDITRLTTATDTLMRAMETDLLGAFPVDAGQTSNGENLARQARLMANDVVALVENVKASKSQGSGWSAVLRDLQDLFSQVQSFEKTLQSQPTDKEIETSLHAVRRRMSRIEARIARLGWPSDLARRWRGVRERLNLISDELGLPRVIDAGAAVRPDEPPTPVPSARPTARIYRGPQ